MSTRIVGAKRKADGDPTEIYLFDTSQSPIMYPKRFVFGGWHQVNSPMGPNIASVLSGIQRGIYVDLPVASYAGLGEVATVQQFALTYPTTMAKAFGSGHEKPDSWLPVVRTTPIYVSTCTRIRLGDHSWWVIERGELTPQPLSSGDALTGSLTGVPQASVFSVEPAAIKAFGQWMKEAAQGEERLQAWPVAKGKMLPTYPFTAMTNKQIAAGLSINWTDRHQAELQRRELKEKKQQEAARAVEEMRAKQLAAQQEKERRIAAGDVTLLDDTSLAARLRNKRAKGLS